MDINKYKKYVCSELIRVCKYNAEEANKIINDFDDVINILGNYDYAMSMAYFLHNTVKKGQTAGYLLENYKKYNSIYDIEYQKDYDELTDNEKRVIRILAEEFKHSEEIALEIFNKYSLIIRIAHFGGSLRDDAVVMNKFYQDNVVTDGWISKITKLKKEISEMDNTLFKEISSTQKMAMHKNNQQISYYQLTNYERETVDYLRFMFHFSFEDALKIFNMYYEVYDHISGDEPGSFYAEGLGNAYLHKNTPKQWMEHIHKWDESLNQEGDKNIKVFVEISPYRSFKGFKKLKLIKNK